MIVRHPPGRAGRVWLRDRLAKTREGVSMLERRRDLLLRERRRLSALADQTSEEWTGRYRETVPATIRLTVAGGRTAIVRAEYQQPADAKVQWKSAMGVEYPGRAEAQLGDPPDAPGPAAFGQAVDNYRAAVEAAVRHAAASTALERIDTELEVTHQRLRALRDRLVPGLAAALRTLEIELDEAEREELLRVRWSKARSDPLHSGGGTPDK
jgi:V/A-type H+-transporting ATPase subunit D